MKKRLLGFLEMFLCIVIISSLFTGCVSSGKQDNEEEEFSANVWTASGTEKIIQNVDYTEKYNEKTLKIDAVRNEYESAQIIISSSKTVPYTIELAPLKAKDGSKLEVADFTIYHEKYIKITEVYDKASKNEPGNYPDALLPYETALKYGENLAIENGNQGIWVTVHPKKDQPAGTYVGEFYVYLQNTKYTVPVEVKIYDYTLSDETHVKTIFNLSDLEIALAELDATREMAEAYSDFLIDYRISGSLPYTKLFTGDYSEVYDYFIKYTKDERCSGILLPWTYIQTQIELNKDGYLALDEERGLEGNYTASINTIHWKNFETFLTGLLYHSLSNNLNLFEKATFSTSIFDEFDQHDEEKNKRGLNCAVYNTRRASDLFNRVADVIESLTWTSDGVLQKKDVIFNSDNDNGGFGYEIISSEDTVLSNSVITESDFTQLKREMVTSLRAIRHVTTASDLGELGGWKFDNMIAAHCPGIRYYYWYRQGKADLTDAYADKHGSERWCYTCAGPAAPYATYHIDDYLLSSRLLAWQMYQENVVGNLYWSTGLNRLVNLHDKYLSEASSQLPGQDSYQDPERYPGCNGDGFLLYPGRIYGIYGPIGSVRLHSIRDGNEDYDLLYDLENIYRLRGVSEQQFDSIFSFLSNNLYEGDSRCVYVDGYLENFSNCRDRLVSLLELASNLGVVLESHSHTSLQSAFVISAPKGVSLQLNGEELSGNIVGEFVKYNVSIDLSQQNPEFNLSATNGEKNFNVSLRLYPVKTLTDREILKLYNGSDTEETNLDGKTYIGYICQTNDKEYIVKDFNFSSHNIDYKTEKIAFKIYYSGEQEISLHIQPQLNKGAFLNYEYKPYSLKQGWNEFEIDLWRVIYSDGEPLNKMRLYFQPIDGDWSDFKIVIDEFRIYG